MAVHDPLSGREPSAASPPPGHGWLSPFRALRHPDYRLFFFGQMVSLVGSWMQTTALMWLAFHLTQTSRWPAIVAAAQLAPACLLGAWGGLLADRWSRRRLVFQTQTALMILALVLAALVYASEETVWLLLVISLAIGVINAIDLPARLAFLVEMVGKDDLVNAVGLNSLMFNLARAAGPALGYWLLPLGGPELCFLLNGLSFLAVLVALARMRSDAPPPTRERMDGWKALREGFRYVGSHPVLALLLPLTIAVALFGWPLLALLPAIAQKHLHAAESGYSSLLSAFGVGALAAALLVAWLGSLARRWLFIAAGVSLASASLVSLSFADSLPLARACAGGAGAGLVLFFATSQAVFQLSATDSNRGRVMSIYSIVLNGAIPLGHLLSGPAADHSGEPFVLRLQGFAILACALAIFLLELKRRRRRASSSETNDSGPTILPFPTLKKRQAA